MALLRHHMQQDNGGVFHVPDIFKIGKDDLYCDRQSVHVKEP